MKIPRKPPALTELLFRDPDLLEKIAPVMSDLRSKTYWHWDELRHRNPPEQLSHEQWWAGLKLNRLGQMNPIPLLDKTGKCFRFSVPDIVTEQLHYIDMATGGRLGAHSRVGNVDTRDQYIVSSLMREAITSSQLEGAVTTREVAKDMIRTGRAPRDRSERMILNNFRTMQEIIEIQKQDFSAELLFEIHRIVTDGTLEREDAAGRLRRDNERIDVGDMEGNILHEPPVAEELPGRLEAMCAFANGVSPDYFVHPAVRAILLHFWLAYDHPFVDGNGRTARALFYWAMLHGGYWLFEYVSISDILNRASAKYYRSFLYTETDDNDLTYFLVHQTDVIRQAIQRLDDYIARKTDEQERSQKLLKEWASLNHRQIALLSHALRHPGTEYTVEGHQRSHGVVYETARKDLLTLQEQGLLNMRKRGRAMVFSASTNLLDKLKPA